MTNDVKTVPKVCLCEVPNAPKDAAGKIKGNVCQSCQGVIPPIGTDPRREVASLLIQVQGTMSGLTFQSETERAEFASYLRRTLPESWRQKLLGWQNNRACAKIKG